MMNFKTMTSLAILVSMACGGKAFALFDGPLGDEIKKNAAMRPHFDRKASEEEAINARIRAMIDPKNRATLAAGLKKDNTALLLLAYIHNADVYLCAARETGRGPQGDVINNMLRVIESFKDIGPLHHLLLKTPITKDSGTAFGELIEHVEDLIIDRVINNLKATRLEYLLCNTTSGLKDLSGPEDTLGKQAAEIVAGPSQMEAEQPMPAVVVPSMEDSFKLGDTPTPSITARVTAMMERRNQDAIGTWLTQDMVVAFLMTYIHCEKAEEFKINNDKIIKRLRTLESFKGTEASLHKLLDASSPNSADIRNLIVNWGGMAIETVVKNLNPARLSYLLTHTTYDLNPFEPKDSASLPGPASPYGKQEAAAEPVLMRGASQDPQEQAISATSLVSQPTLTLVPMTAPTQQRLMEEKSDLEALLAVLHGKQPQLERLFRSLNEMNDNIRTGHHAYAYGAQHVKLLEEEEKKVTDPLALTALQELKKTLSGYMYSNGVEAVRVGTEMKEKLLVEIQGLENELQQIPALEQQVREIQAKISEAASRL